MGQNGGEKITWSVSFPEEKYELYAAQSADLGLSFYLLSKHYEKLSPNVQFRLVSGSEGGNPEWI